MLYADARHRSRIETDPRYRGGRDAVSVSPPHTDRRVDDRSQMDPSVDELRGVWGASDVPHGSWSYDFRMVNPLAGDVVGLGATFQGAQGGGASHHSQSLSPRSLAIARKTNKSDMSRTMPGKFLQWPEDMRGNAGMFGSFGPAGLRTPQSAHSRQQLLSGAKGYNTRRGPGQGVPPVQAALAQGCQRHSHPPAQCEQGSTYVHKCALADV